MDVSMENDEKNMIEKIVYQPSCILLKTIIKFEPWTRLRPTEQTWNVI